MIQKINIGNIKKSTVTGYQFEVKYVYSDMDKEMITELRKAIMKRNNNRTYTCMEVLSDAVREHLGL